MALKALHDEYLNGIQFQTLLFTKVSAALSAIKRILNLALELKRLFTSHVAASQGETARAGCSAHRG